MSLSKKAKMTAITVSANKDNVFSEMCAKLSYRSTEECD